MGCLTADHSVFQAIADPTRRAILDALREGDQTVLAMLGRLKSRLTALTQSGFSQHLAVLRKAGLVYVQKAGRMRVYSLRADRLAEVADWISEYDRFWTQRLDNLGRHLARKGQSRKDETG